MITSRVIELGSLPRYPVTVWNDGTVTIDISRDDGGWSGCGHSPDLELSRADIELVLATMKELA